LRTKTPPRPIAEIHHCSNHLPPEQPRMCVFVGGERQSDSTGNRWQPRTPSRRHLRRLGR